MKTKKLKILNFIINIVLWASVIYSVFNVVMAFLPVDIQLTVYNWLHMSQEYIATFSVSSIINASVIVASKLIQSSTRTALTKQLIKAENTIIADNQLKENVVEKFNLLVDNAKVIEEELYALMQVQEITAKRNIGASDMLVLPEEKEAYKKSIETIEKARQSFKNLKNITNVYEKTEIKEVIVEVADKYRYAERI